LQVLVCRLLYGYCIAHFGSIAGTLVFPVRRECRSLFAAAAAAAEAFNMRARGMENLGELTVAVVQHLFGPPIRFHPMLLAASFGRFVARPVGPDTSAARLGEETSREREEGGDESRQGGYGNGVLCLPRERRGRCSEDRRFGGGRRG